ncbi:MAG: DUF4377 domain-containing protein [Thermoanaerobaculia bacterium]|nr:DUF4377 domain-containing protein [Thermoanaerobaculia bacterium]
MFSIINYTCAGLLMLSLAACAGASPQQSKEKEMKLKIMHYKVPCTGADLQLCYLVSKDGGEAEYFYDEIEGFEYQWGYNYELLVEQVEVKQPMADASSVSYRLKQEVSKEKVSAEETFQLPLTVDDQTVIQTDNETCTYLGAIRIDTGDRSCAELAKGQAAIFRHQEGEPALVLVEIK